MAYVKTIWSTGDTITATLANHGETQYDEAKADLDTHVAAADPHPQYKLDTDAPNAHKATHATGGTDALTPADIGAETPSGAQTKADQAEADAINYSKSYGVGATGGRTTDWNTATVGGSYWSDTNALNKPPQLSGAHSYFVGIVFTHTNLWVTQVLQDLSGKGFWIRTSFDNAGVISWRAWEKLWGANNDGAGSTMDADTVDGKHASDFVLVANAAKVAYGTYTGDGTTSRFIDVGFTPKLVKVYPNEGNNDYMLFINTTTGGKVMEIAWNVTYESLYTTNNLSSDLSIWGKLVTSGFNTSSVSTSLHGNKSNIIYFWEAIG
jgi:hypothetical protein